MLSAKLKVQEKTVWFRSGCFYKFIYLYKNSDMSFNELGEHDPYPLILMINHVTGIHPNTQHFHNYIQAINMHYIPPYIRMTFLRTWLPLLEANHKNMRLTWEQITSKWPIMSIAIRRYIVKKNLIQKPREIMPDKIEDEVRDSLRINLSISAVKQLSDSARKNVFHQTRGKYMREYNEYLYGLTDTGNRIGRG